VTRTTHIIIKSEDAAKRYNVWKGSRALVHSIEHEVEINHLPHSADFANITETYGYNEQTIQVYTDGSKNEGGVGAEMVIFVSIELKARHKLKLNYRCSNNQAEKLAIAKAVDLIHDIDITENSTRTIGVCTDNRIPND